MTAAGAMVSGSDRVDVTTFDRADQFGTSSAVRRAKYQVPSGSPDAVKVSGVPGEPGVGTSGISVAAFHVDSVRGTEAYRRL
jgi:hypothetical protein